MGAAGEYSAANVNKVENDIPGANVVQAGSIHGDVHVGVGVPAAPPVPAQLPATGFFADRRHELDQLRQLMEVPRDEDSPLVIVVNGPGGVGKTTLALRWLHRLSGSYGDGQLFVDLRGFSGRKPMTPAEPLERFLRALGVDAATVPVDTDEQAALFRTLTAGRRVIVMLDNAVSAAQVRPLLPGPGPALVMVTTRSRLSGLAVHGARFLEVGPLNDDGAVELLKRLVGADRVRAEREQAVELVALCGRLPLALCASGARLAARRRWPIARVVRELTDETRRLASFGEKDDDASVQAVFNSSYGALGDERAQRLYRLLGLHPGVDFGAGAAAALLEADHDEASDLLDVLAGANLLQERDDDRYGFHDLLRIHARDRARETDPENERGAAVTRLVDWYLRMTVAADLAVLPGRWHLGAYYTPERRDEAEGTTTFDGKTAALDWLERERPNLVALVGLARAHGPTELSWQLCEAAWPLFLLRKHYRSWIECHENGLAAARACGDVKAESRMLTALGMAHLNRRDFPAAIRECERALELSPPGGHPLGAASALEGLGIAELATGHAGRAAAFFARAKSVHETLGRPRGIALMSRHLGEALTVDGRHVDAVQQFESALRYFTEAGERYHQARSLTGLARARLRAGDLAETAIALREALEAARDAGARHEEATVHVLLADLAERRAESEETHARLRTALAIYTELGAPQVDEVRRRLAGSSRRPPR